MITATEAVAGAVEAVAEAAAEVRAAGKRMDELAAAHRAELASQRRAMVISGAVVLGLGYAIRRSGK